MTELSGAEAQLAALEASHPTAFASWRLLADGSGRLDAHEADRLRESIREPDPQLGAILSARRGDAPLLGPQLVALARELDAAWLPLARAQLELSIAYDETHARHHLGTLTALAVAHATWAEFLDELTAALASPAELGRWRRLAIAAAAAVRADTEPAALAFLRSEAERYVEQVPASSTDTAVLAFTVLLDRRDPVAVELFATLMAGTKGHARTLRTLAAHVDALADPVFAPALARARARKLLE